MSTSMNEPISPSALVAKAREAFRAADIDKSHKLDHGVAAHLLACTLANQIMQELSQVFMEMYHSSGMSRKSQKLQTEVAAAMRRYDLDRSGALDEDEFVEM